MTVAKSRFHTGVLAIDADAATNSITTELRRMTGRDLSRRGLVLGVSGGVDSAVCAVLAARAVGPERVLALLMPERSSSDHDGSLARGKRLCESLGLDHVVEDISDTLKSLRYSERSDAAVRTLFPDFGPDWRMKITIAGGLLDSDRVNYFDVTVQSPEGELSTLRAPADVYLQIVAATNMKQRIRKLLECYHAERMNYAVLGTPNRLEYDLGFFVRGGDGLADVKPIAHLFKTQVYALAEYLDIPNEIREQTPSTDTYGLPQTQEEFYFALPYDRMDLALWAETNGVTAEEAAEVMGLRPEQISRVYHDIERKRRAAKRLQQPALRMNQEEGAK